MATRRRRYSVRHTYTTTNGERKTAVATILAASPDEATEHARTHIINIGKVLGVTEQPRNSKGGFRW